MALILKYPARIKTSRNRNFLIKWLVGIAVNRLDLRLAAGRTDQDRLSRRAIAPHLYEEQRSFPTEGKFRRLSKQEQTKKNVERRRKRRIDSVNKSLRNVSDSKGRWLRRGKVARTGNESLEESLVSYSKRCNGWSTSNEDIQLSLE